MKAGTAITQDSNFDIEEKYFHPNNIKILPLKIRAKNVQSQATTFVSAWLNAVLDM
jgi:fatty acid-binding protein DegV